MLSVCLNRFEYDFARAKSIKINDPLVVDAEIKLEAVDGFVSLYYLFAIFVHAGTAGGGHYILYIRPLNKRGGSTYASSDVWYKFNDSLVTMVNLEEVLRVGGNAHASTESAYMLWYIRGGKGGGEGGGKSDLTTFTPFFRTDGKPLTPGGAIGEEKREEGEARGMVEQVGGDEKSKGENGGGDEENNGSIKVAIPLAMQLSINR
jgi:hypothetical protein